MLGYDHESFWDQTPRTLLLTMEAYRTRRINEHNDRAWLAWHIAAFTRTKKLDVNSLRRVQMKDVRPPTLQDKLDGLKRWVISAGGTVIYKHEGHKEDG